MRLTLRTDGTGLHEAAFAYSSPVRQEDAADTRWLLEDHPRLRGRSADPIAARIEERLRELAVELRTSVFAAEAEARPIRDALADRELLRRLRVQVEEPTAAPWCPWELMLAPGCSEPLSVLVSSFNRFSPSPAAPPSDESGALRVLLVTCRPDGEGDVPFRSVASRIVQAVAASPEAAIQVALLRPPTYPALQAALATAAAEGVPYDVVHFDGHGSYEADVLDERRRRCYLSFEAADGYTEQVSGSILGEDLARNGVRHLLLNACRSAYVEPDPTGVDVPQTTERAFGTLAEEVRAAGVGGVLAVGFNLYVVTAASLVADTYSALAAGRDLGEAVGHARRRLYSADPARRAGSFDWLVPISFHGEAVAGRRRRSAVRELGVQVSTTTPASARVVDPGALDGARSDAHPFYGYDDVLLRLDRACTANRPAEVVGLAGAGKSAVAGEFARWWAATTPAASLVLDVRSYASFDEFEAQFQKQLLEARRHATSGEHLVVLEGACDVLDSESVAWADDDRTALSDWVEQQAALSTPLIMTGRTPSGLPGVETVVLEGLDTESRAELAAHAGFDAEHARSAPGLLRWSQGIPVVVLQLPLIIEAVPLDERGAARKLLFNLRTGKNNPPELSQALLERAGLEIFDVRHLERAALPFVLDLFQSYIADEQWKIFCRQVVRKGVYLVGRGDELAGEGDLLAVLEEEFRPALRGGLVSRISGGYLLHPLAPIAISIGYDLTMKALCGGNRDQMRQVTGIVWGAYIQSVTTTIQLAELLPHARAFGGVRLQRENLINAVELSVLGGWWALALPLLHELRVALLAEAREQEWLEILDAVLTRLRESMPQEQETWPEDVTLQLVRLLAEEAERAGDEERVKALRELQLRVAYTEDVTLELLGHPEGKVLDVGRIRQISALLKRGDVAVREDSQECMAFYKEALKLAGSPRDILRVGEVHLAIARAHLHVTALRDPAESEFHAREAGKAALELGPLGLGLLPRASVSLGNAILEEQVNLEQPDRERLNEARQALVFATEASEAEAGTRAEAHNGLGNLSRMEGDMNAAADEYLAACKEFESAREAESHGVTRSLLLAQTNAAVALAMCGRLEDALSLARAAMEGLDKEPAIAPRLLPSLEAVVAACEPKKSE